MMKSVRLFVVTIKFDYYDFFELGIHTSSNHVTPEDSSTRATAEDQETARDEENYIKFIQSVFCDNDFILDEDDEDEYKPPDDRHDDEIDEDELDNDYLRVAKREVQDLVDGCWQTIIGDNSTSSHQMKQNNNTSSEISDVMMNQDNSRDLISETPSEIHEHRGSPGKKSTKRASHYDTYIPSQPGNSLISNVVSQIFFGENPMNITIDGMPIDAIRNLAARQMSMAAQLLLQLLLLTDDKSECFSKCYNNLMELSNQREKAVKKAALLEMNVESVKSYQKSLLRQQNQRKLSMKTSASDDEISLDVDHENKRLTRAGIAKLEKNRARTNSVADVPMLANMPALFALIDQARSSIKLELSSYAKSPHESIDSKDFLLKCVQEHTKDILTKMNMKYWQCVVPRKDYPLQEKQWQNFDSSSLLGRSTFTPSEDDLLLRGLINHTLAKNQSSSEEYPWSKICSQFLPSKEEQSLQFRFSQMTSATLSRDGDVNRFQEYLRLRKRYVNDREGQKWTHLEDLNLLRGYQVYGDKWQMISIFFLPTRNRKEIKQRLDKLLSYTCTEANCLGGRHSFGKLRTSKTAMMKCCHQTTFDRS